ncbi:unnamed protein product [Dovyalis caffra]|uniref:Uncharacterized protein n=1 Tax=Dovyalis caffra TaxID=77055 RepID=A0AAV1S1X5_9ROSI|nr:unnamed protein product [Dovyalis caffra]
MEITDTTMSIRNHKIKCKGVDVTKDRGRLEDTRKIGDKSRDDKSDDNSVVDQK